MLSEKYIIYKNYLYEESNGTYIQVNQTDEGYWKMVSNYIVNINNKNISIYKTA